LALAHEISHHKSGDLFANLAGFGLLCLHWFNPLAWYAWRAFRFDQEAACDARVLAASEADDRPVYGRAIAKAASGRPLIFASALDNKKLLKQRLRTMKFNDKTPLRRKAGLAFVIAGAAIALPLTASVSYAYVQAPQAPTAPEAPDAPAAPEAPLAPAYQDADYDLDVEVGGDDGERQRIRTLRREHRDAESHVYFDREELRRSLDAIPSREELRAMVEREMPSRAELEAMIERDMPSREELRASIPDIQVEERCDGSGDPVRSEVRAGGNGRPESVRIVICHDGLLETALNGARSGLRAARRAVAVDDDISAEDRREALTEIDAEIARLDAELGR
ncbi:MAG: M56 family metallopeptidase, partial [Sphingomonadales bacterium]|nr:M56 family metallopeptidase [Sphingomonadales bacterium]